MKSRGPGFFASGCLVCPLSGTDWPWLFADSVFPLLRGAVVFGCLVLSRCSDMVRHGLRARVSKRTECVCVKEIYLFVSHDPRGFCIKAHTRREGVSDSGCSSIDRWCSTIVHWRTSNYSFSAMPSNLQTDCAESLPDARGRRSLSFMCAAIRRV